VTPQTLTPAELDELAALEAKATPGEWDDEASWDESARCYRAYGPECGRDQAQACFDAELIAAMRSKLPALLSMARRLGEVEARAERDADQQQAFVTFANEQLTAATARAEALQAEVTAAYDRGLAHGKGPNWQQGYYNLADGVLLLTKERDTAEARAEAAEAKLAEVTAENARVWATGNAIAKAADGMRAHERTQDEMLREANALAQAAEKRCGELEAGLFWYAEESTWQRESPNHTTDAEDDKGYRARAALAAAKLGGGG
jgi:hypothetical protein